MRKWYVIGSLALTTGLLLAVWQFVYHGIPPKHIFWPPPGETPPPAALAESAAIDVQEKRLADVLDELSDRYDIDIEIDRASLKDVGFTQLLDEKITLRLSGVRLQSLLNVVLRQLDSNLYSLCAVVVGDGLRITTSQWRESKQRYRSKVFRLEPLMRFRDAFDEQRLRELIEAVIAPDTWGDVGGNGHIIVQPGTLIVYQTPETLAVIDDLLQKLANEKSRSNPHAVITVGERHFPGNAVIHQALDSPTTVDCYKLPLGVVAEKISQQHKFPVLLDTDEIAIWNVNADTQIEANPLPNTSLKTVFSMMLDDFGLASIVRDETLLITSKNQAESELAIRLYPVADLIDVERIGDNEKLIDAITGFVAPSSWGDFGGVGTIRVIDSTLVVSQTPQAHRQLRQFLTKLRRAIFHDNETPDSYLPDSPQGKIDEILAQRVSFQLDDVPLEIAIERISKQYRLNIAVRLRKLQNMGLDLQAKVIYRADGEPLENALRNLLDKWGMAIVVGDEAVTLTTTEDADWRDEVACFRFPRRGFGNRFAVGKIDAESVIETITSVVAAASWEEQGGSGSVYRLGDVLIVSNARVLLQRVESLLSRLEMLYRTRQRQPPIRLPETAQERRLLAALEKRISVDYAGLSLDEIAERLSKRLGVRIELDSQSLSASGIDADRPRDLALSNVPLPMIVREFNSKSHLYCEVHEEEILITGRPDASNPVMRIYDVRDLADENAELDQVRLAKAIDRVFSPFLSETREDIVSQRGLPGLFFAYRTRRDHAIIENILNQLRAIPGSQEKYQPRDVGYPPSEENRRVAEMLRAVASVHFDGQQLEVVLREIAAQHDLPLRVNWNSLRYSGVDRNAPVHISLKNLRLERVLELLLDHYALTYFIRDGSLWIATQGASQQPLIRMYYVGDLRSGRLDRPAKDGENISLDGLGYLVDPLLKTRWRAETRRAAAELVGDVLIVSGNLSVQQQVQHLLADLRAVQRSEKFPAVTSLDKVLERPVSLRCQDQPLGEVLEKLAADNKLPLWIDRRMFHLRGIDLGAPTTCDFDEQPLVEVVRGLETTLPLVVLDDGDVLRLTVSTSHASQTKVKVYDIESLMKRDSSLNELELCRLLKQSIDPLYGWGDYPVEGVDNSLIDAGSGGGPFVNNLGLIAPFPEALVVLQTPANHRHIARLLELLQSVQQDLPTLADLTGPDSGQAEKQLLEAIRTCEDPLLYGYLLALAERMEKHSPALSQLLKERLAAVDHKKTPHRVYQLYCALHHGYKKRMDLAPLLLNCLRQAPDYHTRLWIVEEYSQLGKQGVEPLREMLKSSEEGIVEAALDALRKIGEPASVVVEDVLDLVANDNKFGALDTLRAIDPRGKKTRKVLNRWLSSADQTYKLKARAVLSLCSKNNLWDGFLID